MFEQTTADQAAEWSVVCCRLNDLGDPADRRDLPDWLRRARFDEESAIWLYDEPLWVLLDPESRMHPLFVTWSKSMHPSPRTNKNYASDLKIFLNRCLDREIDPFDIVATDIEKYLEWRRYKYKWTRGNQTRVGVDASTVSRNRNALHSFYEHAMRNGFVTANPVARSSPRSVTQEGPGAVRRSQASPPNYLKHQKSGGDPDWLTRRAYMRWRSEAMRGLGSAREDRALMTGRNVAFADLLYATGMRRAEGGGLLTIEVPQRVAVGQLYKGRVPRLMAKGRPVRGRVFYIGEEWIRSVHDYMNADREIEIAFGLASGRYEADQQARVVLEVDRAQGMAQSIVYAETWSGEVRTKALSELSEFERKHLYRRGPDGSLRPLWMWLSHGGGPLKIDTWNRVFADAYKRMKATRHDPMADPLLDDGGAIAVHPHMLRHSFALYAFAMTALIELRKVGDETPRGLQRLKVEDSIWKRVQTLLGHRSLDTTLNRYLAPVQAMEFEWFLSTVNSGPSRLDEALTHIAAGDDRVIDVPEVIR